MGKGTNFQRRFGSRFEWMAEHSYQILFALALIALLALAIWWIFFLRRSIDENYRCRADRMELGALSVAVALGNGEAEPSLGPVEGHPGLVIVPLEASKDVLPLGPRWPTKGVRVDPSWYEALRKRYERQYFMISGEGGLLMTLIGILVFMLFRLVAVKRRSFQEIDLFVATTTHELKTPITGVKALFQSMQMGRIDDEQRDALISMGLKETVRLEHMVENLLTRNRLRRTNTALGVEEFSLRECVEQVIRHREEEGEDLRQEIHPGDDVQVRADPDALRTILENLLDNARKYGGTDIELHVERWENKARVKVVDRGIGIAPEDLKKIFQPFYRSVRNGQTVRHGSGLGLSISRELARRMGGDLLAQSEGEGKGSCFCLTLPLANVP